MMKRLIVVSCMVAFTALVIGGCALPKPEFNQTYLPNTVPGSPERKIELTVAAVNKTAKNGTNIKARHLSLYWIEEDNLLFSILSKNRRKTLHSFLVTYSTGQIKALEDAEKDALLSKIEKRIIADKTGISVGEFIGFAMQLTIALAGGGSGGGGKSHGGEHFLGKLENNGYVLDIDATVDSGKWVWSIFSSSYNCYYDIKNRQTGKTFNGKEKIEKLGQWEEQESLENWLKSWRISPDGRFYLIGKTATFVDTEDVENSRRFSASSFCLSPRRAEEDAFKALIKNYPYAALDISPKWDKIALLMIKEDEKTKQKNYWIEFYPFDYGKK